MRTILLSFKAHVFEKLVLGEKIYEHRKVFPNEPIKAYLYVSAPIKSIVGIIYLNNPILIENWKYEYSYDKETIERINKYLVNYKYAMEILEFQNTNMIHLLKLRSDLEKFVVPQMYYFIDNSPLLSYLEENLEMLGEKTVNDFSKVTSNQICKE